MKGAKTLKMMESKESKRGQKLYYFLSRLNAKELKDLHAYFSSPLLGNSLQMARMLRIIQTQVLEQGGKVIDADLFQAEFFPYTVLDEKKRKYIRIRLVQMLDRVLDFVAFMEYKSDTNAHHVHLLKAMHTRGWEKHFERTYEEIEAMPPKKDFGEYHLYRMRREIVRNDFTANKAVNIHDTNLKATVERIDIYITFVSLKYACVSLSAAIWWEMDIDTEYDQLAYEKSQTEPYSAILEIKAYSHAYQMLVDFRADSKSAREHFLQLKHLLENPKDFDKSEAVELFAFASNYCMACLAKGETDISPEVVDLYDIALKKGTLTSAGLIQKNLYISIMQRMCRVGEVEWSKQFLEEWRDKVVGDPGQILYCMNRAFIHNLEREHQKAIELLHNRIGEIEDVKLNMTARNTICRAVWELGDYTWLVALLEAFRQFVSRNKKITKAEKVYYHRYLELFTKMCMIRFTDPSKREGKLTILKTSMEENRETQKYFWLYKILEEQLSKIRP